MIMYEIPPRMQTKKGLFGTAETSDIVIFITTCILSLVGFMVIKSMFAVLLGALAIGGAWVLFIQPLKYGDNARTWLGRMAKFNKTQKIYYYYRGTR